MKKTLAVVKSSVYQDLWVSEITNNPAEVFKSTLMRSPPIGLCELFNTEFIIVKDTNEYPCNLNKACLPETLYETFQHSKTNKNPDLPFLDDTFHKHITIDSVSKDVNDIDWNKYQIVIAINMCIPESIIDKFPNTLWCYLIGENENIYTFNKISKYDIVLNQDVMKCGLPDFSIGFPYSFLGPYTIENLLEKLGLYPLEKKGVYLEINNSTERPFITIPEQFLKIKEELNIPIIIHSQNILENIQRIANSKYFIKIFGRIIRGNGIMEVISAGTLILINKELITYHDLIPDDCHVETIDDIINKIKYFEENPVEYDRIIILQRTLLFTYFYKIPTDNLIEKYNKKTQTH